MSKLLPTGIEMSEDTSEWVTRSAGLASVIARYRDQLENERRIPGELYAHIADYGYLLVPESAGGFDVRLTTVCAAVEELARYDGAVAWNAGIIASMGLFFGYSNERASEEIFAGGDRRTLAGSFSPDPRAVVVEVEGGYRVSGQWPWASGCHNAKWFIMNAPLAPAQGGQPVATGFFAPASELEILDTWHTIGLRGSGSTDIRATEVFVPKHRTFPIGDTQAPPTQKHAVRIRRFMDYASPKIASISLGIAKQALVEYVELAKKKKPRDSASVLAASGAVHDRIGVLAAQLEAARAFLFASVARVDAAEAEGIAGPDDASRDVALAAAHAASTGAAVVTELFTMGGGSTIYAHSPLERRMRDIHVVNHHIGVSWLKFGEHGAALLDGPLAG